MFNRRSQKLSRRLEALYCQFREKRPPVPAEPEAPASEQGDDDLPPYSSTGNGHAMPDVVIDMEGSLEAVNTERGIIMDSLLNMISILYVALGLQSAIIALLIGTVLILFLYH